MDNLSPKDRLNRKRKSVKKDPFSSPKPKEETKTSYTTTPDGNKILTSFSKPKPKETTGLLKFAVHPKTNKNRNPNFILVAGDSETKKTAEPSQSSGIQKSTGRFGEAKYSNTIDILSETQKRNKILATTLQGANKQLADVQAVYEQQKADLQKALVDYDQRAQEAAQRQRDEFLNQNVALSAFFQTLGFQPPQVPSGIAAPSPPQIPNLLGMVTQQNVAELNRQGAVQEALVKGELAKEEAGILYPSGKGGSTTVKVPKYENMPEDKPFDLGEESFSSLTGAVVRGFAEGKSFADMLKNDPEDFMRKVHNLVVKTSDAKLIKGIDTIRFYGNKKPVLAWGNAMDNKKYPSDSEMLEMYQDTQNEMAIAKQEWEIAQSHGRGSEMARLRFRRALADIQILSALSRLRRKK